MNEAETHVHFLLSAFTIAKFCNKNYSGKHLGRAALLVQQQEIIGAGYTEMMALSQVEFYAPKATLYTTFVSAKMADPVVVKAFINSKIQAFIYGYCDPNLMLPVNHDPLLQMLEKAGVPCIYIRIPEVLRFYAPYRFTEPGFK